jgi:large subunit ribosomal protein L23
MEILKQPLITEKLSALNEEGKYAFVVDKRANKVEIRSCYRENVWSKYYFS